MAAGPRDTPSGGDAAADGELAREQPRTPALPDSRGPLDDLDSLERLEELGAIASVDAIGSVDALGPVEPLDDDGTLPPLEDGQSFGELRPQRRLRIWQLAPITALAVGGSLMFAFPLAFESGEAGPVVAMLGLLLCCCSAGWGLMAARRIGQTWPGLPARGSGARPDWRFVAAYTAVILLLATLAVWRVARLR